MFGLVYNRAGKQATEALDRKAHERELHQPVSEQSVELVRLLLPNSQRELLVYCDRAALTAANSESQNRRLFKFGVVLNDAQSADREWQ